MKILLINWQDRKNPSSGGAEIHIHEIFGRIANNGDEITLLCCSFENAKKFEVVDGLKVIRIGKRNTFNFYVPAATRYLLKSSKYDIVVDNINKIPFYTPLYIQKPLLIIGYHFFGSSIFKETNPLLGSYVYFTERLVPMVYKKETFSVLSNSTREELIRWGIPKNNIHIISPAISPELSPDFSSKSSYPLVVYLGRIKRYKCIDKLLFAMQHVIAQIPDARLTIVGTGDYLPTLLGLAKTLKLDNCVNFTGYVPKEEKKKILQNAWVVVNTSFKEGWGITNIEANACGTPVIASNSPGLRDSVLDGKSGYLIGLGDTKILADKIIEVLKNDSLRERLSKNAVEWASRFTWDGAADEMYELIRSKLKRGG